MHPTIGDQSETSSIRIESSPYGYQVTTYPLGTYGFEGFTADVRAPKGIFGHDSPTRVEFSREADGIMRINIGEAITNDSGRVAAHATIEPTAAREGLLLPGDPGFELFDQLHAELGERRAVVAEVLGTLGVNIEPLGITYISQTRSAGRYDHVNRVATHERGTHIEVCGVDHAAVENVYAHIDLDGSQTAPMQANGPEQFPPEWPMVFRSGVAEVDWEETYRHQKPQVGFESLLAFAGLHADFSRMYRAD